MTKHMKSKLRSSFNCSLENLIYLGCSGNAIANIVVKALTWRSLSADMD